MNLDRISLVSFLFNLIQFCSLEGNARKNKRPFATPCFEEGENLSTCSSLDDSCENANGFKLIRLQGLKVSGGLEYNLLNRLGNHTITSFFTSALLVLSR